MAGILKATAQEMRLDGWTAQAPRGAITQGRLRPAASGAGFARHLGMDSRQTLLCATDFTDAADHALAWTSALARRWNATIELVHVLPAAAASVEALATDAAVLDSARFDAAEHRLRALADALARRLGIPVRSRLLRGDPDRAIVAAAKETDAKLVVIGSHGHSAAGRWLLGSTAERTVRAACCPVVIVPPPGPARKDMMARIGDPSHPLRVLAGIDLGPAAGQIVGMVSELRRHRTCEVTLLHLYWPSEEYDRLGLDGPRELFESDPEVVHHLELRMRKLLGPAAAEPSVRLWVRPAWGDPASNLLAAVSDESYDLLVVGADWRHGLGRIAHPSVASRLAASPGDVPVVCVPAARPEETPAELPRAYKVILAPTDLSPSGNRAVRHAYSLLRAEGGVVELCYVHERGLPAPTYLYEEPQGRLAPEQRRALEAELRALVPPEAERFGIVTHVTVIDGGQAAKAIVQAAERFDVDAICIGSHGRGAIARALIGSVADQVVRCSRTPVLVVRREQST
jgi:nucleotide-binding universal stress UspA family protein